MSEITLRIEGRYDRERTDAGLYDRPARGGGGGARLSF